MMDVFDHVLFSTTISKMVLGSQPIPLNTYVYCIRMYIIYIHTHAYWLAPRGIPATSFNQTSGIIHKRIITPPSTINDIVTFHGKIHANSSYSVVAKSQSDGKTVGYTYDILIIVLHI